MFLAVVLGIGDVQTTDISNEWKSILMKVGAGATVVVAIMILYQFFMKPLGETNDYFADLRKDLELS